MSSGGMEWAYRILQEHDLDPLAKLVVLHLGWRDHPNQRTDKGIARALGLHRTSVRRVTASLAEKEVIARRAAQWVACETIAVVEQKPEAPRPDERSVDGGAHDVPPLEGGAHEVPPGGHMVCPQRDTWCAPKRKEKIREGRKASPERRKAKPHRLPLESGGAAVPAWDDLGKFQRAYVRAGNPVPVPGFGMIRPEHPAYALWQAAHLQERQA